MNIRLWDIKPCDWNTRGTVTEESVKELAKSIDENGLINPLTLWKNGNGEYVCIAGNRRLAALLSLHTTDVELSEDHYTIFGGDEHDAKMVTITENLQREDVGIIEEANAVAALLDAGKTVEWIAARLGQSRNWVNRRRKLVSLDDAWKARANEIDPDALEKIAAYPAEVQEKLAKTLTAHTRWDQMRWYFEREMRDLDSAKFPTKACKKCEKRTGAMGDLFGECDGKLGQCLDCKCYDAKLKAARDAAIDAATKGVSEVIRCEYEWQMPKKDTLADKPDKSHPCAYALLKDDGEVVVKYGESLAEKEARQKAENERLERERKARDAEREREDAIIDKLEAWKDGADGAEKMAGIDSLIIKAWDTEIGRDEIIRMVRESVDTWMDADDWARIVRCFHGVAERAGVTDDEAEYLLGEYAEDENEDENENEEE